MRPHQHINQTSGYVDWITPAPIVEAARATMGGIDLDPASNSLANEIVKAKEYYVEDGLTKTWHGRVWLNWPYSRMNNRHWSSRLLSSYRNAEIQQACCISFASTSELWCAALLRYPVCFLQPRVAFLRLRLSEDGRSSTLVPVHGNPKGSMVTYLGPNITQFYTCFQPLGEVLIPYDYCQ